MAASKHFALLFVSLVLTTCYDPSRLPQRVEGIEYSHLNDLSRLHLDRMDERLRSKTLETLASIPVHDKEFISVGSGTCFSVFTYSPGGEIEYTEYILEEYISEAFAAPVISVPPSQKRGEQVFTVPVLHSAVSGNVMYLDFDGEIITNSYFNAQYNLTTIVCEPFDLDGDPNTLNATELSIIKDVHARVVEDYRPYNIDISTERPPGPRSSWNSTTVHVIITLGTNMTPAGLTVGGKATLGTFGSPTYNYTRPAFVYYNMVSNVSKWIADAISHESGHNFGLSHDGQSPGSTSYYIGVGTGPTSWGPIMGSPYKRALTQWSNGDYENATNTEDDMQIIGSKLGWINVPTPTFSSKQISGCDAGFFGESIIRNSTDSGNWTLTLSVPSNFLAYVNISALPWYISTDTVTVKSNGYNLDIELWFNGTMVSAPLGIPSANYSVANLLSGAYPIMIRGSGEITNFTNFSNYGSAGYYNVTVCVQYKPFCTSGVCCDIATGIPLPKTVICRNSTDLCDAVETCDGISGNCPADSFSGNNTICRPSVGACDLPTNCTGTSASCPQTVPIFRNGTLCRPAVGTCDVAEFCDGNSAQCPTDIFAPNTTVCHAGECEEPSYCVGDSSVCPSSGILKNGTVCRPAIGPCDYEEKCNGRSTQCPIDIYYPSIAKCRNSSGVCDKDAYCTGTSVQCPPNSFLTSTTLCRNSSGPCDVAEHCTGNSSMCPPDVFSATSVICRQPSGVCESPAYCPGNSGTCPANLLQPAGTLCRPAVGICDEEELCSGLVVTCPPDEFLDSSTCDSDEFCLGNSSDCPNLGALNNSLCEQALLDGTCKGVYPLCLGYVYSYLILAVIGLIIIVAIVTTIVCCKKRGSDGDHPYFDMGNEL